MRRSAVEAHIIGAGNDERGIHEPVLSAEDNPASAKVLCVFDVNAKWIAGVGILSGGWSSLRVVVQILARPQGTMTRTGLSARISVAGPTVRSLLVHDGNFMEIVAGLSLRNLKPRVWDPDSPFHLPDLRAVMVSYAEFDRFPARRRKAMEAGLHGYLGLPDSIKVCLDNGSFAFARQNIEIDVARYEAFVQAARPDWWPIAQDFIPAPSMTAAVIEDCIQRTMRMNRSSQSLDSVPVIHICSMTESYLELLSQEPRLLGKRKLALGGIVPNLLRAPKALPYPQILNTLWTVRTTLLEHQLHLFGVGGTSTLHLAALLGIDSVDSSGWRNRAARGIVQLPGHGDRSVADLGSWSGRKPSLPEWSALERCRCPACQAAGLPGLRLRGIDGFCNRATHNLWTLLEEARLIEGHLAAGSYQHWYGGHIRNSTYRPLIDAVLEATDGRSLHPEQRSR